MSSVDRVNLSINGKSQVPPGFRFHPTEEELLHYYLRKKVAFERIDLDVIREVDLNKLEPWDIQEKCKIGSTPQNDWYFFSHKDKKYPTGTRTNRATAAGFWKATGRDKIINSGFRRIGLRKTLVFYKGRAPHGQKSDWIMHEYRLDESNSHDSTAVSTSMAESMTEDGWVVCRVFKKKNYQKALESPKCSSAFSPLDSPSDRQQTRGSRNDAVLDQILMYMGGSSSSSNTCKLENNHDPQSLLTNNINNISQRFMHLPRFDSSSSLPSLIPTFDHDRSFKACYDQAVDEMLMDQTEHQHHHHQPSSPNQPIHNPVVDDDDDDHDEYPKTRLHDWATFDRLVASQLGQLNGQDQDTSKHLACFGDPNMSAFCSSSPPPPPPNGHEVQLSYASLLQRTSRSSSSSHHQHHQPSDIHDQVYSNDNDLWSSFTKSSSSPSSSDPLCHLSV